ncbi:MAG: hypothetical protein WCC10_10805 [Tumebacillaceae bacterium]
MDKPRINLNLDASLKKDDGRERNPSFIPRAFRSRKGAGGTWRKRFTGQGGTAHRALLLPFSLATITGVLLGVCLLILFKGQQSEPAVSIIPPPAVEVKVSGVSMFAWQLGSFPEKAKAETAQAQLSVQGVQTTIRGEGPFQLFAAVAPDKKAGLPVEMELQKRKIPFYAKEYKIAERTGVITGLQGADGQKAAATLGIAAGLADQAVQAALAGTGDKALVDELTALQGEWKAVSDSLVQAGQKEQAARWDDLYKRLTNAVEAVQGGQGLLAAEGRLSDFYISYETLISQLIL